MELVSFIRSSKIGLDSYYFDHAYFDAGYKEIAWVRICKMHTL